MADRQNFTDRRLKCVDCGCEFTFPAGEQRFFASKSPPLTEPKRCPSCRQRRKATIARYQEVGNGE
jgi:DNA-directed RNA polymerase subunit RPC12/RpoP